GVALGHALGQLAVGGGLTAFRAQSLRELEQIEVPTEVVAACQRQRRHEADLARVALPAAERRALADDGAAQADPEEDVEEALQGASYAVVALAHGRGGGVVLEEHIEGDARAKQLSH